MLNIKCNRLKNTVEIQSKEKEKKEGGGREEEREVEGKRNGEKE